MTLLHIFPSFSYGGQQRRLAQIAKGLGAGFHHRIIALDGKLSAKVLFDNAANVSFEALVLQKASGPDLGNLLRLRRLLRDSGADILCTYNWGSIEAALANRLGGGLVHIHFEDGFGPDETINGQAKRRMRTRWALLRRSIVVTPSRALEELAKTQWKLPARRVRRIANGVEFDRFQHGASHLSAAVSVGTVGALRAEKNYPRLIRSFLRADREGAARLLIVGEGPERDRLSAAIKAQDCEGRVFLMGASAKPEEQYAQFDIFALSSDQEQAPLSVMEAMAAGLPIVAPNLGEIYRMVSEENRAFITPPGDEEAYALALAHLLQNPDARANLGASNRKKAREAFALSPMIARYRDLFMSCIEP